MLNLIPGDTLYHISTFLNFKETLVIKESHPIPKCLDKHIRQKQFKWLQNKLSNNLFTTFCQGHCADDTCSRQKAICIDIIQVKTHVLSQYCSQHTLQHKYINAITLI
jgi:hypothetical protein